MIIEASNFVHVLNLSNPSLWMTNRPWSGHCHVT